MDYKVLYLGDRAITFEFGQVISKDISQYTLSLHQLLKETDIYGIIETVPTFRSLSVHYDPLKVLPDQLIDQISPIIAQGGATILNGRKWSFPCCYDGEDLSFVAAQAGCSTQDVILRHSGMSYDVFMLGFLPGFAFMGVIDETLRLPRRAEPRTIVPKGSVAIADQMTAVYPSQSPGGWHLIGRTPIEFFPNKPLLQAGDRVSFHPVGSDEFISIHQGVTAGAFDVIANCLTNGAGGT